MKHNKFFVCTGGNLRLADLLVFTVEDSGLTTIDTAVSVMLDIYKTDLCYGFDRSDNSFTFGPAKLYESDGYVQVTILEWLDYFEKEQKKFFSFCGKTVAEVNFNTKSIKLCEEALTFDAMKGLYDFVYSNMRNH